MQEHINSFISHTIANLKGAQEKQDIQLTWAILKNLSVVIDTYIEALEEEIEMSDLSDTINGSGD